MAILLVLGCISLLLGILFLVNEENLKKIQDVLNKPLLKTDEQFAYKYRVTVGIVLIILSGILFFAAHSLK